jgi:hypothetical protein
MTAGSETAMAARPSPRRTLCAVAPSPDDRVVSLSPRRVPADPATPNQTPAPMSTFSHAAPVDEAGVVGASFDESSDFAAAAPAPGEPSLDRFAAELSAMIEVAACTADSLNKRLQETAEGEHRAAATSAQLQEQLRLGARMLKAFQSQIAGVEHTLERQKAYERQVAEVQAKIEQCFAGIETCIDKTLESVALRLADLARTAVDKFDEGIAQRERQLQAIDARMAECAAGIDGVCSMVEQVQDSAGAAVNRNQHTLEKLEEAAASAKTLLSQHEQARRSLASDLHALKDGLSAMEQQSAAHSESAAEALQQAMQADTTLRERMVEIEGAQRDSERVAQTVVALNELLVRLQPWEKFLLDGHMTADGLPEPLAKVAGEVRKQISQDMNWLSLTMKDVAERVSHLAQVAPAVKSVGPVPSIAPEPGGDDDDAAPQPEIHLNVKKPLRLRTFNAGA